MRTVFRSLLRGVLALLIPCAAALTVQASMLSPGLAHYAEKCDMVKSSILYTDIGFCAEDFENAVGYLPTTITITALPPAADGVLYFGSLPAAVNQTVSAGNLSLLRFVPAKQTASRNSVFRFRGDNDYSHACSLRYTDSVNRAPVIAEAASVSADVWTQQDIGVYGTLSASDPDGDSLMYDIVQAPLKGILRLTSATGEYQYTPYDGALGTDVFTYRVRDEYGNYSPTQTVSVTIVEAAGKMTFADMKEHWALNAAVVMAAEDIMPVFTENGELFFHPDDPISREEFLVTVMKALGAEDIAPAVTVFADEEEINPDYTGYVARASALGIIQGVRESDGKMCFHPRDTITRAQAAVILNAIIGADTPETLPTFADNDSVPVWAKPSLYALHHAGILRGTGAGCLSPEETVSRAQTAQILLTIKNLLAN